MLWVQETGSLQSWLSNLKEDLQKKQEEGNGHNMERQQWVELRCGHPKWSQLMFYGSRGWDKFKTFFRIYIWWTSRCILWLIKDFKKISIKNKNLKIKNEALIKEKEETLVHYNKLKEKNETLKREVDKLKPLVDKFTCYSNKL